MQNYKQDRNNRLEEKENKQKRFFKLRNVLNVIFMVFAIIGVIVYFALNENTGIIIVLFSMVFKMVESVLRMMK